MYVKNKRADGFHDLETIFYPVQICDALELLPGMAEDDFSFTQTGLPVDGAVENNICLKALKLLQHDFPQVNKAAIHLHKTIPMGAGMGGGSSDAAFMLKLCNEVFDLKISSGKLQNYALQLGSDCPFFLHNKPVLASGRGEIFSPISLNLSAYNILIVHPGIHVSTKTAFSRILLSSEKRKNLEEAILLPIEEWRENIFNDFEIPVFQNHPELKSLKQQLYDAGAIYSSLTGSGSAVYGIFDTTRKPEFDFPGHYFYKWV